jgi:NAD(P)-dependent dehydrogenase (short-subunit alcohol dehydrogenase family)
MTVQSLKNKKIVISAGASGIGWAITKTCVARGAQVFLCDINDKLINKINKNRKYKNKIFAYECDASNESDVINFFTKVLKKTKKIDSLINNIGIAGPTATLEKINSEEWEKTLQVNVVSHFYFNKQAIPVMKKNKRGSIINLSSGAGIMGFPLRSPYAASKWAIVGLTKTLAMELGKFRIRVNAICPGTIKGKRMKQVVRDKAKFLKVSQKMVEKEFVSMASMNSWIYEDDIGKICAFLISNDSERISGQIIGVDGNATRLD